jgi:hypothetical protein
MTRARDPSKLSQYKRDAYARGRAAGLVLLQVWVHPADKERVRAFADNLRMTRAEQRTENSNGKATDD